MWLGGKGSEEHFPQLSESYTTIQLTAQFQASIEIPLRALLNRVPPPPLPHHSSSRLSAPCVYWPLSSAWRKHAHTAPL